MFISLYFPVILAVITLIYFTVPKGCRPAVLLAFSYLLCAGLGLRCLVILLALSSFTFFAAIATERSRRNYHPRLSRLIFSAAVSFCILLMAGYKYIPYFLRILGMANALPQDIAAHLAVPIGLSFYLFQSVSYLTDVYQGKCHAEKDFVLFGVYMAYFPKFVSGPIERFPEFSARLRKTGEIKFWDRGRLSSAFTYMLYGYFMKLVIADRLSPIVTALFEAPESYDSLLLAAGAFSYTIQIYCDFAGYSFIAIGCSKLLGISLTANFVTPYFAESITDFWRRWHVSLSGWLRDYLYIPLGGNRKGLFVKCANTMIVFLVCGMWHGAGLNFLAWGFLHGAYSIADALLRQKGKRLPLPRLATFLQVSFAWIFFRASGLGSALRYIRCLFTSGIRPGLAPGIFEQLNLSGVEIAVILAAFFLVFLMDFQGYQRSMLFPDLVQEKKNSVRYLIFYTLIILLFIFGIYGPGYHTEQFIYMQF